MDERLERKRKLTHEDEEETVGPLPVESSQENTETKKRKSKWTVSVSKDLFFTVIHRSSLWKSVLRESAISHDVWKELHA